MNRSGQRFALRSEPLHKPSEVPPPVHFRSSLFHYDPIPAKKPYKENCFKPKCPSRVKTMQLIKKSKSAPVKVNYNQYNQSNQHDFFELMLSRPKLCVYGKKPISQNVFRKPNLPKRPRSAPPSSRYTNENPPIVRSNIRIRPNIYSQPVIVYNGQTHPLPTTDIRPVPSDVLLKPENVVEYTIDESYLQTIDINNNNKNKEKNNKRKSKTNTTITNNNNNNNSNNNCQNEIEDDVIIEDIDEIDNLIPICNRITYDENIFNNEIIAHKPTKERPKSARPSSGRRMKYINDNNNNNCHRPQSAIPIVTPHKQKRLADTLTSIKITNETKDPESFITKLTDAVFTPIGVSNLPVNNSLLKYDDIDNIPSPWVIEHYAY